MKLFRSRGMGDACIAPTTVLILAWFCGVVGAEAMGPLVVCPANPRYFQNAATGQVVLLTGSHTWANLVDMGTTDPPPAFDFEKYVDWMAGLDHNFKIGRASCRERVYHPV